MKRIPDKELNRRIRTLYTNYRDYSKWNKEYLDKLKEECKHLHNADKSKKRTGIVEFKMLLKVGKTLDVFTLFDVVQDMKIGKPHINLFH